MEPSVEIFSPSPVYARAGWAALAGSLISALCGFRAPLAFIPALLCAATAATLFWLAKRPPIRLGETQFNIGERAIAWREVREINRSRFLSPLILRLKLTNQRYKILVYPGDAKQTESLLLQLRKNSHLATFDGASYREYWNWENQNALRGEPVPAEPPVRMFSSEDEAEIERLYQTLKTVGRLDPGATDPTKTSGAKTSGED